MFGASKASRLLLLSAGLLGLSACPVPIPIPIPAPAGTDEFRVGECTENDGFWQSDDALLQVINEHPSCSLIVQIERATPVTIKSGEQDVFGATYSGAYDVMLSTGPGCTINTSSCKVDLDCGGTVTMKAAGGASEIVIFCPVSDT